METLSRKLSGVSKSDPPGVLQEAKQTLIRLYAMNRRWNIAGLAAFLKERQRALFFESDE
jgi:hypothetical protein